MSNGNIEIVDFHAHILPGADHGSSSVETSLGQLALASAAGVKKIIATPHFYPHKHTLKHFLERRERCANELFAAMGDDAPEVKLGAEVLLCAGLENFAGLDKLTISGTDYILLELPFADFRDEYCDTAHKIQKMGLKVILAHVDRYPKQNIEKMLDAGITRLQVNADSLSGLIKPRHILDWADEGLVLALGSDIHGVDKKAYKRFTKAKAALSKHLPQFKDFSNDIFD